jgi:hypothetical protein
MKINEQDDIQPFNLVFVIRVWNALLSWK